MLRRRKSRRSARSPPRAPRRTVPDSRAPAAAPPASNFLRAIIAEDNRTGKYGGKVVTRFPPEPNGYLHYGHAKSIILNFGLAAENGGRCNLRFDDTNPAKEDVEFESSIADAVRWLGFDWGAHRYHASDYYDQLYAFAEWFIEHDLAYVDSSTPAEMRALRGTLTEAGKPSVYRSRSVAENLDLFRRMKAGEFPDGAHVLRLKIDLASPNINMRDPAIYRIRHASHHRTGDKWCIYPLYDYTHCISDALEGITHSICTLEFQDHRPLYDWVLARLAEGGQLPRPLPQQYEFARLNLTHVLLSKRKLIELVAQHDVDGWDDPRMPTLVGARRRGFTPEGFRLFAERIGVSKSDSWIDMSVLEDCMREDLNARAPRRIAVLDPVRLVIDNYPAGQAEDCLAPNHPQRPELDKRALPFSRELWIERDDYQENAPKGYFRLAPGAEVRLRYAYIVRCVGRREGCRRQRHRRALHVRPGHAQRHARRRRAQGQGQHPLAVGRARAAGRSAALRPAVRRAVSRGAPPAGRGRRRGAADGGRRARDGRRRRRRGRRRRARRAQLARRSQSGVEARDHRVRRAGARRRGGGRGRSSSSGTATSSPISRDHAPGKPVFNRTVTLRDSWAQR